MYSVLTNSNDGTIIVSESYDALSQDPTNPTPYLNNIGDEYIINISNLQNVIDFTEFSYDSLGLNPARYLFQYYRISKNGTSWSDWVELNKDISNFPQVDPNYDLNIEIKWVREGSSTTGSIRLLKYELKGSIDKNEEYLSSGSISILANEKKLIISPFIFKVFKITDIEVIPNVDLNEIDIRYRYSQDNERTWSDWEPLTKENITTTRINPIRFFQIQYSIENKSRSPISINDINLIGDFQNVNNDYQKVIIWNKRMLPIRTVWSYGR